MYKVGYDIEGRQIIINDLGKYVTHIPCHLSIKEVISRLSAGENISFDGINQGMQNIPDAIYDFSDADIVAPEEMWPLFTAWEIHGNEDVFFEDMRTFEEYQKDFLASGLTPEAEMQIITAYQAIRRANPRSKMTYDQFRQGCIQNLDVDQSTTR